MMARYDQNHTATGAKAVDKLVLAKVNAPYRRSITAEILAECLAKAEVGNWPVHIATFFTEIRPRLVLTFAAGHSISKAQIAQAYLATKKGTGEQSPDLEATFGSLAAAAS